MTAPTWGAVIPRGPAMSAPIEVHAIRRLDVSNSVKAFVDVRCAGITLKGCKVAGGGPRGSTQVVFCRTHDSHAAAPRRKPPITTPSATSNRKGSW